MSDDYEEFEAKALDNLGRGRYDEAYNYAYSALTDYDIGATAAQRERKLAVALKIFDKLVEIYPRVPDTWIFKGATLNALGKYKEAIGCYDKALELDPENFFALNNRAISEKNAVERVH